MKRSSLVLAALLAASTLTSAALADSFTVSSAYWGESATDASGNYNSPVVPTNITGTATSLSAPIMTDGTQALANIDTVNNVSYNVVNYVRAWQSLAGTNYDGSLLGDLSGKSSISASFNLQNSNVASGSQFTIGELAGQGLTSGANVAPVDPSIRFSFSGANGSVWFSTVGTSVTSMSNGADSSLTINFDPSAWSNLNGINGSADTADFNAALGDVTKLGFSFGSGYFYSDGFAFNTGGNASFNLDSISTAAAAPLPASVWSGLAMLGAIAAVGQWKRSRLAKA
jgi:hypothetical protein